MIRKLRWKDCNGNNLTVGDIIEDASRRAIGKLVEVNGIPCIRMMKVFRNDLLGYELLDYKGPEEAYIRALIPHSLKIGWWLRGYVLDHVEILRQYKEPRCFSGSTRVCA